MHIWTIEDWLHKYDLDNPDHRTGLYTRFEKGIDPEVRRACLEFCKWLRTEYFFPIRVVVYFRNKSQVKDFNGENVNAFFGFYQKKQDEPFISISAGNYSYFEKKEGKNNALSSILNTIAHELTHYFQWINDIKLTPIGEERQATMYSGYILDEYKETRDEP